MDLTIHGPDHSWTWRFMDLAIHGPDDFLWNLDGFSVVAIAVICGACAVA